MDGKTTMSDQEDTPENTLENSGLNERQQEFVRLYVFHRFNASRAARDAGYSESTAGQQAHDLLKNPKIQEAIKAEKKRVLEDLDDLRVLWLKEVKALAMSDIRDVQSFDENGVRYKNSDEISDDAARAIETVESVTTYDKAGNKVVSRKVKLHSKKGLLDTLGKHLGMLQDDPTAGVTIVINQNETDLA